MHLQPVFQPQPAEKAEDQGGIGIAEAQRREPNIRPTHQQGSHDQHLRYQTGQTQRPGGKRQSRRRFGLRGPGHDVQGLCFPVGS